jgi:DNA-binding transcriptional LysR family regulator
MTHAGRAFLAESRAIIALAEKASLSAGRVAHGDAGTVTVGFTASSGCRFLPGLIATCRRRLPDVDLALMRPQFANEDFDSLCVAQEPLVAALPENHALVRKTHGVRPAELFMAWRLITTTRR